MRILFLGCTKFSQEILEFLISEKANIVAIAGIPEFFKISYSENEVKNTNYANLEKYAKELKVPYIEVNSVKGKRLTDNLELIEKLKPDVIFVMGWYYMIPKSVRSIAKFGAWGIHASLLPNYAGGAPLVWAIIEGQKETGVTLFRMEDGVDDGDIIEQIKFPINDDDTIKEVYNKATFYSKKILIKVLNSNLIEFKPQDKSLIKVYPQRSPKDGEIDFNKKGIEIYNFIRAQSSPYPGAFFRTKDGKKIIIEKARLEDE